VDWVLGFGEMLEGVGVVNNSQQANGSDQQQEDEDAEEEVEEEDEKNLNKLDVGEGSSKNQELLGENDSSVPKIDDAKEEEVYEKLSKMDIQTPSKLPDISTPQADVIR